MHLLLRVFELLFDSCSFIIPLIDNPSYSVINCDLYYAIRY